MKLRGHAFACVALLLVLFCALAQEQARAAASAGPPETIAKEVPIALESGVMARGAPRSVTAEAAVARINLDGRPSDAVLALITSGNEHVLSVQLVAL